MKGHFAFYVETVDEHKSPLHSTGTGLEDMVLDAMEIYEDEKEPVFLRISFGDLEDQDYHEEHFPLVDAEGKLVLKTVRW